MRPEEELVVEWLRKAEGDFLAAEQLFNGPTPVLWIVAFHAQQAVEKFTKSLLTFYSIEFERSHDIDYLMILCRSREPEIEGLRVAAARLTEYAVESRYPLARPSPTEAETREAIQVARHVREFVRGRFPEHIRAEVDRSSP